MEFEKVLQELEEIAKKMEDKNTTLDESLALFDKGVKKSSECIKVLNETKGKAELLILAVQFAVTLPQNPYWIVCINSCHNLIYAMLAFKAFYLKNIA